ncbi:Bicyclomycin resistance protein [bacterium HR39]|nr:Bicyclomycin resistance protein [bacterium HR39]
MSSRTSSARAGAAHGRLSPESPLFVVLLAGLMSISAMTTDINLPAVPAIAADFGAPVDSAQLTVTLFFVGFGAGQLVVGPLSDRTGRRPVLLGGLALFTATSLLCALAPSLEALLALRTLQGAFAAAAPVLGRAVVRDLFAGARMARVMSFAMAIFVSAPLVAPSLGAALMELGGWRSIFLFLALYGTLTALAAQRWLPETLPCPDPDAFSPRRILGAFAAVFGHPRSRAWGLVAVCAFTVLLVYLTSSPVVFMLHFGLPPAAYGLTFAAVATFSIAGNLANARLVRSFPLEHVARAALLVGLLATSAGALLDLAGLLGPWSAIPLFGVALFCFSVLMSDALALAMQPHARIAGAASSVLGVAHTMVPAAAASALAAAGAGAPWTVLGALALAFAAGLAATFLPGAVGGRAGAPS